MMGVNTIMRTILRLLLLCAISSVAWAQHPVGIGLVAQNMMTPVSLLTNFVSAACFIIGGSFLFASIIKFIEHRRSPLMVPISTVVFLFIAGTALVLLPFIMMLSRYVD